MEAVTKIDCRKSEDETTEESSIKWINLIFLPYNPIFKFIVLITVIIKCVMGPVLSVYNYMYCSDIWNDDVLLSYLKAFYVYFADPIYCVDTVLHIVHRQVEDEARKREYIQKSVFALLLDVLSLLPLFSLARKELCHQAKFWPNILSFTEMLIIYQVVQYFSLNVTHSIWRLTTGYIIIIGLVINAVICFFLLLTYEGLCAKCKTHYYDWRGLIMRKYNGTNQGRTYYFATIFVISYCFHDQFEATAPHTTFEFVIFSSFMFSGYIFWCYILIPRFFAESLLRNRRRFSFNPRVARIIEETKRRNPSSSAYKEIQYFYSILWRKRKGIYSLPDILSALPMYLQKNIRQDLVWAVFYHSPIFRKTSSAYRRWLSEHINLEFKLPGERFFTGSNCFSNLYYIKSGVVQIYSADDCTSPILSVTGGTIFGDCSFILPPLNRKLIVRCFTYCEVLVVSRTAILTSLHKFPEDRRIIMKEVREKIKHARGLFKCKQLTRGLDRSEDEGIAWLKKRWWEISAAISRYKRTKRENKCELPAEETNYHCAKYIGQLVLSKEEQLRQTSIFVNIKFPYLLAPHTTFGYIWNSLIYIVVWLIIIIFPPSITKAVQGDGQLWFTHFRTFVNTLYILDVVVSLITTVEGQDNLNSIGALVSYRLKSPYFILDLLSTSIADALFLLVLSQKHTYVLNFNEFLKTYMIFVNKYERTWHKRKDQVKNLLYKITLVHLICMYVFPFFLYTLHFTFPKVNTDHYIMRTCKQRYNELHCKTEFGNFSILVGFNSYLYCFQQQLQLVKRTEADITLALIFVLANFIIYVYSRATYLSGLYLKNREMVNYQYFVKNLKKYFVDHKLHPDLMKRLEHHLTCHWKYFKGMDILFPNPLQDEPYDVYWRHQGEIAQKVISESMAFKGADPALIKDLVHKSKFLILPRNTTFILFGLQIRTIMWLIHGSVKCEYHNDKNELEQINLSPVELMSFSSVFLDRAPLRTYIALSDCEILLIPYQDYACTLNSYPEEKKNFEQCAKEIRPRYDELLRASLIKHSTYQKQLREKILHGIKLSSVFTGRRKDDGTDRGKNFLCQFFHDYRTQPESKFIIYWMHFRVIIAILSILCGTIPGVLALVNFEIFIAGIIFEVIGVIDIIIKLFLPYYDERGLVISAKKKCIKHYLVRGFVADMISSIDVGHILVAYISKEDNSLVILIRAVTKSVPIYLVMGYLNYKSDMPNARSDVLMVLKWLIVLCVAMLVAGNFFTVRCIQYRWDKNFNVKFMKRNTCWIPKMMDIPKYPTKLELNMIFAMSLSLVQYGFNRMVFSLWEVALEDTIVMCSVFLLMGLLYWMCSCMCQMIVVLHYRGDTYFQQSIGQLKRYLIWEVVEKHLIKRILDHFEYWWLRTKGVNVQLLLTERIGVVFKQDLNYYFYKKTLEGVDSLLGGGEVLQRGLVCYVTQSYYLGGQDIIREHDLATSVFFVHRGKVSISKGHQKLADITKGSIFGQLDGKTPRPIRVTALTEENTDLLVINLNDFQQNITDKIRKNISSNPQSKNDYLAVQHKIVDDPEATIEYMLRKSKVIQLPRMKAPIEVQKSGWYFCWVFLSWFLGPVVTAFIVVMHDVVDDNSRHILLIILIFLDFLYVGYLIAELFAVKLVVVLNKCVYKHKWLKKFTKVWLYVDILSLVIPVVVFFTGNWKFSLARLARIHITLKFYKHNCTTVRGKIVSPIVKIILILLLLHTLACGWVSLICRRGYAHVNLPNNTFERNHRDLDFWHLPHIRNGCLRLTTSRINGSVVRSFFVPSNWVTDYLMAFYYMVCLLTSTNSPVVFPVCLLSTYFKIIATFILYMVNLYICSLAVSTFYTKYREKNRHDYKVSNLLLCLKYNGLSNILLDTVQAYIEKLWQTQQGRSMPSIIKEAPLCLQQDIMSALYMHHLLSPPLFQYLPPFFLRQLVTRLGRIVAYPDNRLVREGDIFPRIFFIHEGEVEKWYQDATGEVRMGTVLTKNGYFGLIPGLFPNTPYQFTYYSRTVVDLVFLDFNDWQDLLNGYPDIKRKLYTEARKAKLNVRKMTINN